MQTAPIHVFFTASHLDKNVELVYGHTKYISSEGDEEEARRSDARVNKKDPILERMTSFFFSSPFPSRT